MLLMAVCVPAGSTQAQVVLPPGWRWATDRPATVTTGAALTDSTWRFTQMAPGWHITTRPGAIMYDPGVQAHGRYSVESVQILFPGTSQSGYGLLVGGRELDGPGAEYLAFLVRRDGQVGVEARRPAGTATLFPWTPSAAVHRVSGDSTARNVLRVTVDRDSLWFEVNATRVAALPRNELGVDGYFGFRTGPDLNLHITTLDHTVRLAPVPAKR